MQDRLSVGVTQGKAIQRTNLKSGRTCGKAVLVEIIINLF